MTPTRIACAGWSISPADAFLLRLREHFGCMLACEARHGSWFSDSATALLQRHRVTRVIADPPAGQPGPYVATSDDGYIRLHGSPRMYYSAHDEPYLAGVAEWLQGRNTWCIFDNTAAGAAILNALRLQKIQRAG
ncbi:DUF72 domain-containing protein [Duganella sp. FT50W]|uniref:DUF72 domain-containing protein n=1 Tax=Duganella lactea TaxID=2692173 RepID=A0A6L8MGG0_9BURK|nr:DUF72 domain-containing protein [Duganella lactea]MYM82003.1 DUF72 domain-containing protein [Duganella lactea]